MSMALFKFKIVLHPDRSQAADDQSFHKYVSSRSTLHWIAAKTQDCWTTQTRERTFWHIQKNDNPSPHSKIFKHHLAFPHSSNAYGNPIF